MQIKKARSNVGFLLFSFVYHAYMLQKCVGVACENTLY